MRTVVVVLACLAAGTAVAQDPGTAPDPGAAAGAQFEQRLAAADRNGDSMISREEAAVYLPRMAPVFDRMDANADGQLTRDEMTAFGANGRALRAEGLQKSFLDADLDSDGALDLAEAQVGMPLVAEHFTRLDLDNDGRVTAEELSRRGR
jgi:hypothetical protein